MKSLRKAKGLTLVKAAEEIGYSNPYLSQIETGKKGIPSPEILKKLARAYNHPYLDLAEKAGILSIEERNKAERIKQSLDPIAFTEWFATDIFRSALADDFVSLLEPLKEKYSDILEPSFQFNLDALRNMASDLYSNGSPEETRQFISLLVDIKDLFNKEYPKQYSEGDLFTQIDHPLLTYKGIALTESDRHRILSFLDGLFAERLDN